MLVRFSGTTAVHANYMYVHGTTAVYANNMYVCGATTVCANYMYVCGTTAVCANYMYVCGATAVYANLIRVKVRQAWVRAHCGRVCVDVHPCMMSGCLRACTHMQR